MFAGTWRAKEDELAETFAGSTPPAYAPLKFAAGGLYADGVPPEVGFVLLTMLKENGAVPALSK